MVNRKWLVQVLVFSAVFGNGVQAQKLAEDQQPEQTSFGAEAVPGEVLIKKPAEIREGALEILRDTLSSGTLHCLKGEGVMPGQIPASWFVASEIHLNGLSEADLIVQPRDLTESSSPNRCLFGAHAVPFWVLGNTDRRYGLLLKTDADALEVLDSRTNGFRNIQTWSSTAVTHAALIFKFDGHQYRLAEKKIEP